MRRPAAAPGLLQPNATATSNVERGTWNVERGRIRAAIAVGALGELGAGEPGEAWESCWGLGVVWEWSGAGVREKYGSGRGDAREWLGSGLGVVWDMAGVAGKF